MLGLDRFLSEIFLSLTVSFLALYLLKRALQEVLTDLCQGAQRADFWTRFTQLMLIIGPLLGTLFLAGDEAIGAAFTLTDFRETLRYALMGGFVTLCGIGLVIWKTIPGAKDPKRAEADSAPSTLEGGG